MAHEQSETVEIDGRFYNVYGRKTKRAGQPLAPVHDFEKDSYDNLEEAVAAAEKRSKLTDQPRGTILTPRKR